MEKVVLDRRVVAELKAVMMAAKQEIMEDNEEVWLSKAQFLEQFQMFTPSWLEKYGKLLPRSKAIVTEGDVQHETAFAYPRNQIQRMIRNNEIKMLNLRRTAE